MSDFTQVPVLLLYAVNSLTLKAWITTSSESSLRQIAWLQAVVWVVVALWRCAQRRLVLRSVTKQLRHTLVGGLLLFAQSYSCILALQHHNFARLAAFSAATVILSEGAQRPSVLALLSCIAWTCIKSWRDGAAPSAISLAIYLLIVSWRSATSQPRIKAGKRVVAPQTVFLDDGSILGCAFVAMIAWFVTGTMTSGTSLRYQAPGNLLTYSAIITTILSISTSLTPIIKAPKSLLVGLWPDAQSISLQQKLEVGKERIGFWPAIVIGTLMTMSVPDQAPDFADLGFVVVAYGAIIFASTSFRRPDLQPKLNRPVTVAEAYAPVSAPVVVARNSALQQLIPPMLRSVLKDILRSPESSKIFYFLLLNLAYMFIQLLWGVWTNSLGLISDAIHMAFDCVALGVGLFASVMATWESDSTFTYGYSRIQTLSGFANGVFLILISIFIIVEGLQRIANPPQIMNMKQLLMVSAGGLGVNLWGMYATGHHHHGHGGHSHDHHGHDHHDHGHSANMHGVFLHVLADTMGSVGVIISTLLIKWTGYAIFDPIASLLIAALIIASVIPLIISSAKTLCLEVDKERVNEVRNALAELSSLEGVESYGAARFWPKDEGAIIGSIHIQLAPSKSAVDTSTPQVVQNGAIIYVDPDETRERVEKLLYNRIHGLEDLHVQLEAADGSFCPCRT
ncbi:putative zinc transporter msc2 [Naganishia albida]|nr:putative zinc transporter msc2 [Naganishia albida]